MLCILEEAEDRIICEIERKSRETKNPLPVCEEFDPMSNYSYWELFYDDISGKMLDTALLREARRIELACIEKMTVWELVPRLAKSAGKLLRRGRWVDINTGDDERPRYRSRYVGKEIKRGAKNSFVAEFFAAMPPLQGCKCLLILAVTKAFPDASGNLEHQLEQLVLFHERTSCQKLTGKCMLSSRQWSRRTILDLLGESCRAFMALGTPHQIGNSLCAIFC